MFCFKYPRSFDVSIPRVDSSLSVKFGVALQYFTAFAVATNVNEWYIFDSNVFEKQFAQNKGLVKQFNDFENGKLAIDAFYRKNELFGFKKTYYLDGRQQALEEHIDSVKYLQEFSDYRQKQAKQIESKEQQLENVKTNLESNKKEKTGLLQEEQKEKANSQH